VVNRCAIHHDGFLFDKGGEALVVEVRGASRLSGEASLSTAGLGGLDQTKP
jgi:hypothetical protein